MREKYMMETIDPSAEDAPYVLIEKDPSVRVEVMMARAFASLSEDFATAEEGTVLMKIEASAEYITAMLACGIVKIGGNWELYAGEWGEPHPVWPRQLMTDEDFVARRNTAAKFAAKEAKILSDKIMDYMNLSKVEVEK